MNAKIGINFNTWQVGTGSGLDEGINRFLVLIIDFTSYQDKTKMTKKKIIFCMCCGIYDLEIIKKPKRSFTTSDFESRNRRKAVQ